MMAIVMVCRKNNGGRWTGNHRGAFMSRMFPFPLPMAAMGLFLIIFPVSAETLSSGVPMAYMPISWPLPSMMAPWASPMFYEAGICYPRRPSRYG